MNRTEDSIIMRKVKEGDTGKLAILFERHHIRLFNFFLRMSCGNRELSEDLVQEVFCRILKYRATYDDRNVFVVWFYRISRNVFIDHLKKTKAEFPDMNAIDMVPDRSLSPGDYMEKNQLEQNLREALNRLPVDKREILIMSKFEKLKCREIAGILKCTTGTVKVRIFRSLKTLGKKYTELSGGEIR